jgi:protease I
MTDLTARETVEKLRQYDDLRSFPKINIHFLATAAGNEHLLKFMTEKPDNPIRFKGKRIAIIATHGVEETEVSIPRKWLEARGAICHLVSPNHIEYAPAFGIQFPEIAKTHVLAIQFTENSGWIPIDARIEEAAVEDYDAVYLPGAPGIRISCAPTQPCCPSFKNFRRQANPWAPCATARRSF